MLSFGICMMCVCVGGGGGGSLIIFFNSLNN